MISVNVFLLMTSLSFLLMLTASIAQEHRPIRRAQSGQACEGSTLNIECQRGRIDVIRANYGRQSKTECNPDGRAPIRSLNCLSENSVDIVKEKCSNQQRCSIEANNRVFGDPCFGTLKYLDVEYQCTEPSTPNRLSIKTAIVCEGSNLDINCDRRREEIFVVRANYGRKSGNVCNDGRSPIRTVNCSRRNSQTIVGGLCSGKRQCTVSATNAVFGDPCVGTHKYLEVDYICYRQRRN